MSQVVNLIHCDVLHLCTEQDSAVDVKGWAAAFSPGMGVVGGKEWQVLLANEMTNFQTLSKKVRSRNRMMFFAPIT